MVFVLDDIAKIENERKVEQRTVIENFTYLQPLDNITRDQDALREIQNIMDQYVSAAQHYVWNSGTGGVLGVFTDAFLNAGWWGNKDIPGKRIRTCIKYGILGSIIYVEDEGEGFDYNTQIEKLQRGEQHDFTHRGGGMRKFHRSPLHIAYHGGGNKMSIATKVFSEDELLTFVGRGKLR